MSLIHLKVSRHVKQLPLNADLERGLPSSTDGLHGWRNFKLDQK